MKPNTQILLLEAHRANLAAAVSLEEYKTAHIAYVDLLIQRSRLKEAGAEAIEKFAWRVLTPEEETAVIVQEKKDE